MNSNCELSSIALTYESIVQELRRLREQLENSQYSGLREGLMDIFSILDRSPSFESNNYLNDFLEIKNGSQNPPFDSDKEDLVRLINRVIGEVLDHSGDFIPRPIEEDSTSSEEVSSQQEVENSSGSSIRDRRVLSGNIVSLYAGLYALRRGLPENPNDSQQSNLIDIIDSLLVRIKELEHLLVESNASLAEIEKQLAQGKDEAKLSLRDFTKKSTDSIADQVGPTIKWLVTSGSLTLITAEAVKGLLS